jgi:hypothetical protein
MADGPHRSPGDFSDAYRLAEIVLGNPILTQNVVHDAVMAVRLAVGSGSEIDLDADLASRLDVLLEAAVLSAAPAFETEPADELAAALAATTPRSQILLARAYGPWDAAEPAAGELRALQGRLTAGSDTDLETLELRLRRLYDERDPGAPAPLPLRLRLRHDQDEVEAKEVARESDRAARAGRHKQRIAVGSMATLVALTLSVTVASMVDIRGSRVAAADPTGDPASPLVITDVSVLQSGIPGPDAHVGATQRTWIATFAPLAMWHTPAQQCMADVVGTISWSGQATWIGQRTGQASLIAGDPSSGSAVVAGLGPYCAPGRFATSDGGQTWSPDTLPAVVAATPSWLAFDPSQPGYLAAYGAGRICARSDPVPAWTCRASATVPIAFDSTGRLVGWSPGRLLESPDDGITWRQTGPGPADRPVAAGATTAGVLVGGHDGLWWYPLAADPVRLESDPVFSISTLGDSAVVLGADPAGHPFLATVSSADPGLTRATLPAELEGLKTTGGEVAVNDAGAVAAFSGPTSAIAVVSFAY